MPEIKGREFFEAQAVHDPGSGHGQLPDAENDLGKGQEYQHQDEPEIIGKADKLFENKFHSRVLNKKFDPAFFKFYPESEKGIPAFNVDAFDLVRTSYRIRIHAVSDPERIIQFEAVKQICHF